FLIYTLSLHDALPIYYTGVNITGVQGGVAGIGMNLFTSDPLDPNFSQTLDVQNTSGFAWTGYLVDVSMNNTFSISNAIVNIPPRSEEHTSELQSLTNL